LHKRGNVQTCNDAMVQWDMGCGVWGVGAGARCGVWVRGVETPCWRLLLLPGVSIHVSMWFMQETPAWRLYPIRTIPTPPSAQSERPHPHNPTTPIHYYVVADKFIFKNPCING